MYSSNFVLILRLLFSGTYVNKQFGRNILMFLQHIDEILSEYKVSHPTRMSSYQLYSM